MSTQATPAARKAADRRNLIDPEAVVLGENVSRSGETVLPDIIELAASIKDHGQKDPVTVRRLDSGDLELVAGFRRHAAISYLKAQNPADDWKLWYVVDTWADTPLAAAIASVLENVRVNPSDLSEARANERLRELDPTLTDTAIAKLYGRTNTNRVLALKKLLETGEELQAAVEAGNVSLAAAVEASGDKEVEAAVVAKAASGKRVTKADAGAAKTKGDESKPVPRRNNKDLSDLIDELEGDEKDPLEPEVLGVLTVLLKFMKGVKGPQAVKNALAKVRAR